MPPVFGSHAEKTPVLIVLILQAGIVHSDGDKMLVDHRDDPGVVRPGPVYERREGQKTPGSHLDNPSGNLKQYLLSVRITQGEI